MNRSLGRYSSALVVLGFASSLLGVSCQGSRVKFPQEDLNPHPQTQKLKAGKLEQTWRFDGKVVDGVIPGSGIARGEDLVGNPVEVHFELKLFDPCVKNTTVPLPLYRVWSESSSGNVELCPDDYPVGRVAGESRVCGGDAELARVNKLAVAVPGYYDKGANRAHFIPSDQYFTIACITGVAAKCAHWGYMPGAMNNEPRADLGPYYSACVHAALADYENAYNVDTTGPTGSYTCEGTIVDIFDNLGIQTEDENSATMSLESSWIGSGPISIARPRYVGCQSKVETLRQFNQPDNGWLVKIRSDKNNTPVNGDCPATSPNPRVCVQ